jgi:hypothetical protein
MSLVLDDLPEELIVEICGHLDIFDLVAFSVVGIDVAKAYTD